MKDVTWTQGKIQDDEVVTGRMRMFERLRQWLSTRRCKHEEWTERTGPHYDDFGDAYYEERCLLCGYRRVIQ